MVIMTLKDNTLNRFNSEFQDMPIEVCGVL